uniref:Uncharacterized protein n=1 Tax=Arion vulgaris TaxID=1028688 RepID=A0A0B7BIU8_9EUPU
MTVGLLGLSQWLQNPLDVSHSALVYQIQAIIHKFHSKKTENRLQLEAVLKFTTQWMWYIKYGCLYSFTS